MSGRRRRGRDLGCIDGAEAPWMVGAKDCRKCEYPIVVLIFAFHVSSLTDSLQQDVYPFWAQIDRI